ncbi:MAG: ATP-binding cassette domain-containing protein [Burkholderiaceae bacterium]|jgi:ATP-binding cassette subfamily F protein 3|nr:ATP-binding cassette domain-containing protein [Burkholderiaceae bacterium]
MIQLNHITLRRGAKVLLQEASVTLQPGEKAALIGRNGAGKSSLFALLSGALHEDSGECDIPRHWRMAQVAQNMPETDAGATDFVLAGDAHLLDLQARLASAEAAGDGMAIAQAHADLADAGAYDARARAQALIAGLGFKPAELDAPVNRFSGGWRMRLQLARALIAPSELLLLDEPTNHLDMDALVWLEGWLQRYPGTLIVISHDREFLDAVTSVTIHLERAKLTRYGGNYSAFEVLRAQQLELQQGAFERQQEKIAHLQKFIDRFKAKATKARQAQSRVKALERMQRVAPVLAEADFSFEFRTPGNIPNPMLAIQDASFGYASKDGGNDSDDVPPKIIVRKVNLTVLAAQRIGILGANGQGKSTFIKTIAHELPLLSGTITEGKGLRIGYFAQQELDVLRPQDSPLEHMTRLARQTRQENTEAAREQQLRNFLGTFNFPGEMVTQPVGNFSGGEKARLVLAMMVWQRPNLLLLDEPTNHLDLITREALGMALNSFEGTLMLVSHDRALLRATCDEFWLVSHGGVSPFEGTLDDYQNATRLAKTASGAGAQQQRQPPPAPSGAQSGARREASGSAAASSNPSERRKRQAQTRQQLAEKTRPLKKEMEQVDKTLARLGEEKTALETKLTHPLPPAEIAQTGNQLKAIHHEIEALEARWLDLMAAIETATATQPQPSGEPR